MYLPYYKIDKQILHDVNLQRLWLTRDLAWMTAFVFIPETVIAPLTPFQFPAVW